MDHSNSRKRANNHHKSEKKPISINYDLANSIKVNWPNKKKN